MSEQDLRQRFPSIDWNMPIPVSQPGTGTHYACRYCIALYGLHGSDVKNLWQTSNEVLAHIETFHQASHPPTSTATGAVDGEEGEPLCDGPSGGEPSSYKCPVCKMESFNPNDIKYRYCGNCNRFNA